MIYFCDDGSYEIVAESWKFSPEQKGSLG